MTPTPGFQARARGLVQGVGFRVWARLQATRLRLKGYVRNLPDESVEIVACVDAHALEEMLDLLKAGPAGSRVTSLDVVRFDGSDPAANEATRSATFEIRR